MKLVKQGNVYARPSVYELMESKLVTWSRYTANVIEVRHQGYCSIECIGLETELAAYGVTPISRRVYNGVTVTLYKGA